MTIYYPGTRVIKHKQVSHIYPFCSDCDCKYRDKEWDYDEKGRLTRFYRETEVSEGWGGTKKDKSVTKWYANGILTKVDRTKEKRAKHLGKTVRAVF